jgi:hypothetical protein
LRFHEAVGVGKGILRRGPLCTSLLGDEGTIENKLGRITDRKSEHTAPVYLAISVCQMNQNAASKLQKTKVVKTLKKL